MGKYYIEYEKGVHLVETKESLVALRMQLKRIKRIHHSLKTIFNGIIR